MWNGFVMENFFWLIVIGVVLFVGVVVVVLLLCGLVG